MCGCFLGDGRGQEEAVAQTGDAVAEPSPSASEDGADPVIRIFERPITRLLQRKFIQLREELRPPELDDFPLEQSR